MKLILASNNAHKLQEMRDILSGMGYQVVSQREAGLDIEVEETGTTFAENARLKARAVVDATGEAAIADDSGIAVEALGGQPGIYSARYGGDRCKTDRDRLELLLKNMRDEENRRAEFVSAICCLLPDGTAIEAEGHWPGELLREPRGEGGFGYDPIFYVPERGCSSAELSQEDKNAISHRGRALTEFKQKLEKYHADK